MTAYIKSKKFNTDKDSRGLAVLSIVIVLAVFGLGFVYLLQTNSLVGCSYDIRQQKEEISRLQVENQSLEMEIVQLQSPANLEQIVNSSGMIGAGQITYLENDRAVAVKK
ncbi:MAG: hypothetical protein ABIC36_03310 [bacterium]